MKHQTTMMLVAALLALHAAAAQTDRPYAGQHMRSIEALSPDQMRGYLDGAGMGFAKAAELNRYPGAMHALELAAALAQIASYAKRCGRDAPGDSAPVHHGRAH